MKIINLTPHDINIYNNEGRLVVTIPRSGIVARARQVEGHQVDTCEGVPIFSPSSFGEPTDIPDLSDYSYAVVSLLTAKAANQHNHPDKDKLVVPADIVRDENGQIIGCRRLEHVE